MGYCQILWIEEGAHPPAATYATSFNCPSTNLLLFNEVRVTATLIAATLLVVVVTGADGARGLPWGSSSAQVIAQEGSPFTTGENREGLDVLAYMPPCFGLEFTLENDPLVEVRYFFLHDHREKLAESLSAEYGHRSPWRDGDTIIRLSYTYDMTIVTYTEAPRRHL